MVARCNSCKLPDTISAAEAVEPSTKTTTFILSNIGNFVGYRFIALEVGCCFVLDNKLAGVYASVSEEDALGSISIVRVSAVQGSAEGKTLITNVVAPNGLLYDTIYNSDTDIAVGAAASGTEVAIGVEFTPADDDSYILLARGGYVVATSGKLTLPVVEAASEGSND